MMGNMIKTAASKLTAVAMLSLLIAAFAMRAQRDEARTNLAIAQAQNAQATANAQAAMRLTEQAAQKLTDQVAQDDHKRQTIRFTSAAGSDRAVAGLLNAIAAANARAASESASAAASAEAAATARELLGACAAEYRDVAKVTDTLSDQVTGLHQFFTVLEK